MKKKKRCIPYFNIHEKTELEKYLEEMAEKGWILDKITSFYWQFHQIEPAKIHFTVTYYPTPNIFNEDVSEEQEIFFELCEHDGWKVAAFNEQMNVFYNKQQTPVPIETDAVLEVENIHKVFKKQLPTNFLVICALLLGPLKFITMSIEELANNNNLLINLLCFLLALAYIIRELKLNKWYKRAKKAAHTDGHLLAMPTYNSKITRFLYNISSPLLLIILLPLLNALPVENMAQNYSSEVYYFAADEHTHKEENELPLTIENLITDDQIPNTGYYNCKSTFNESLLLKYYESNQESSNSLGDSDLSRLWYKVSKIKVPLLYEHCLNLYIKNINRDRLREEKDDSWDADAVYRFYDSNSPTNDYIICWDNYIAYIFTDCVLTTEQKDRIIKELSGF